MKREYHALYTCDEWKFHDSMRLIGVFSLTKLRKIVKRKIKKNEFEYSGTNVKEINNMEGRDIDKLLKYGYIQQLGLNEEQ